MVALALLPLLVFWAETLGLRVFYYHDVQYYFFPYHKLVIDITQNGHVPLWNPHAFSGIPLLADGQTAIFYPPNWLLWLLPTAHALTLVILLQFSIAGVGMFAYVRSLRISHLAATVAALTFMFNGFLFARVVHLSILSGAALIPLVFWGFERLLQRRSYGAFVLAVIAVALQAVAGHPQLPIYTAVALGMYTLTIAARQWWRARRVRALLPLAQLAAVYTVGYMLAAIQLLPWIAFARFSPRAAGTTYEFVTGESLRGWDWLLFLFPYGLGGLRTTWLQSMPEWILPIYLWERLGYVGILPLALAAIGVVHGWRTPQAAQSNVTVHWLHDRYWALLAVSVVAALIAAGNATPFGRLVYALPVIGRLRGYSRAVVLVSFVLAALAAYGVERLRMPRQHDYVVVWIGALLVTGVAGVLLLAQVLDVATTEQWREPMHRALFERGLQIENANAYIPLLLAVAGAAVLWWARTGLSRLKAGVLLAIIVVDLVGAATSFNPTTVPAVFERVPPSVQFLQRDSDQFRVAMFVSTDILPPDVAQSQLAISWALPYGIDEINGFNSLQPRRYTDVLFGPEVSDVSYGLLRDERLLQPDNHLLSMLNVKYIVVQPQTALAPPADWQPVFTDDTVTIYRNPRWQGRAAFAERVEVVPDAQTVLMRVREPGFDPLHTALVEAGIDASTAQRLSHAGNAEVQVAPVSPNELHIRTQTDAERFLVLSEMWFPGWQAQLDGQPLPIYRTNYLLRGVVVPPGEHIIRMVYRPTSVLVGATTTLATTGALVVGRGVKKKREARGAKRGVRIPGTKHA
jgi:hypothetical protein